MIAVLRLRSSGADMAELAAPAAGAGPHSGPRKGSGGGVAAQDHRPRHNSAVPAARAGAERCIVGKVGVFGVVMGALSGSSLDRPGRVASVPRERCADRRRSPQVTLVMLPARGASLFSHRFHGEPGACDDTARATTRLMQHHHFALSHRSSCQGPYRPAARANRATCGSWRTSLPKTPVQPGATVQAFDGCAVPHPAGGRRAGRERFTQEGSATLAQWPTGCSALGAL